MTKRKKKAKRATGLYMTPRLEACLEAGSAERLRELLADWSERELHLLHRDLHVAYGTAVGKMDFLYQQAVHSGGFLPEIEAIYRAQRTGLKETFAEIHQELIFYLDKSPKPKGQIQ